MNMGADLSEQERAEEIKSLKWILIVCGTLSAFFGRKLDSWFATVCAQSLVTMVARDTSSILGWETVLSRSVVGVEKFFD
jgi:hypothetical protein